MAKTKAKTGTAQQTQPATHQADPERWNRLLMIWGVVAVVIFVFGFIAFGWYWTQIRPFGKIVLRVESTEVSLGHLERRMSLWFDQNAAFFPSGVNVQQLADITLDDIEREAKFLEAFDELEGISVTDEEMNAEILERGGNATGAIFGEELNRLVRESGLEEGEYLQMVRAELLEEKVREHFTSLVADSEPQVRFRWILIDDDEEEAQAALERLEAGEDFAEVVSDVSVDATSVETGGEQGWRPRDGTPFMPSDAEDFLFESEVGERSDVISDTFGRFYIVELLERDDNREIDEAQLPSVAERHLNEWLTGLDSTLTIERDLSTSDLQSLGNALS